jgi:uncharacterized protein YjbI with pentapeptide repeats
VGASGASVNFSNSILKECVFSRSVFTGAKFHQTDLQGANFDRAVLNDADFREAQLNGADLCRAELRDVRFRGAKLFGADLRGADLTGARELTSAQLMQARTDDATILPNGARGPFRRNSGAERPVGV